MVRMRGGFGLVSLDLLSGSFRMLVRGWVLFLLLMMMFLIVLPLTIKD